MEATASFLLAALALTGSPGPNTLSVAAVGASFGRVRGLGYMLGLNLGMVAVIIIVGTGVAGMILAAPGIAPVVTGLAAIYFLYLAYKIATAPPLSRRDHQAAARPPRWFEGAGLSLINPKAYAAMAALFSGYTLMEASVLGDTVLKATLALATICLVNITWLFIGAGMTQFLKSERTSRIINVLFAVLLLISVAFATLG